MIYLELFLSFFKIGLFTFGGGYAMISIVCETVLSNGWLTEGEIMNFIAVSESTPGPIAINMATFVGSSQGGFLGALCSTVGVVLPSFIIILLISTVIKSFMNYNGVKYFLYGVRPCAVALILATATTMGLKILLGFSSFGGGISPDWKVISVFIAIALFSFLLKKFLKKKPSPILLICVSAVMGILFFR